MRTSCFYLSFTKEGHYLDQVLQLAIMSVLISHQTQSNQTSLIRSLWCKHGLQFLKLNETPYQPHHKRNFSVIEKNTILKVNQSFSSTNIIAFICNNGLGWYISSEHELNASCNWLEWHHKNSTTITRWNERAFCLQNIYIRTMSDSSFKSWQVCFTPRLPEMWFGILFT